jgi:hypothetical protein
VSTVAIVVAYLSLLMRNKILRMILGGRNHCKIVGFGVLALAKGGQVCWTNIVSALLLLGIRSLNALLAHSIAVNTSYRSSLVLHTWAYKPLHLKPILHAS